MTVKLVVLYAHPGDQAAFDEHYLGVHGPLVRAIPGLRRFETGHFAGALDGGMLLLALVMLAVRAIRQVSQRRNPR